MNNNKKMKGEHMRVYTKELKGCIVKNIYEVEGRTLNYNRQTKTMEEEFKTVKCQVAPKSGTIAKMLKATDFVIDKVKVLTYAIPLDQFTMLANLVAVDGELTVE